MEGKCLRGVQNEHPGYARRHPSPSKRPGFHAYFAPRALGKPLLHREVMNRNSSMGARFGLLGGKQGELRSLVRSAPPTAIWLALLCSPVTSTSATRSSRRLASASEFRGLQLITPDQLHAIRKIWLYEKHEFDDSLPRIYEEVTGQPFPAQEDDSNGLRADDWALLRDVCGEDRALFDLQVALLGVERRYRGISRRTGVFSALEEALRGGLYGSEEEAVSTLRERKDRKGKTPLDVIDLPAEDARPQAGRAGRKGEAE
jgi:hypothetical protein